MGVDDDYGVVFSGGGAFAAWEVGAYRAILSRRHKPPAVVSGASAGALNAAAVCAGISVPDLEKLWESLTTKAVFQNHVGALDALWHASRHLSFSKGIRFLLHNRQSIFHTEPLIKRIEAEFGDGKHGRFPSFRESHMSCVVAVTDLRLGRRVFYVKRTQPHLALPQDGSWHEIDSSDKLQHALVASTALPVLFPPSMGGYFDGGILLNQPIQPALVLGAKTIYVLIPNSTREGDTRSLMAIGSTLLSTWMASSFDAEIERIRGLNLTSGSAGDLIKLCVVRPGQDLAKACPGAGLLAFGSQVRELIEYGHRAADARLNDFHHDDPSTWDSDPEKLRAEGVATPRRTVMRIPPDEHIPKEALGSYSDSDVPLVEVQYASGTKIRVFSDAKPPETSA